MSGSAVLPIPIPDVNTICAYTFAPRFASLNGIYKLSEILSFGESLKAGVNLVTRLYVPAGLTSADYLIDAGSYQNDAVLYLEPVNDTGVAIYVPASLLATMPDPMVGCYNNLAIGVSLGLFADQTQLNWVINELQAIIASVLGVTAPTVRLYSLGVEYMRVIDYDALVAQRAAAMSAYKSLYQQLQEQIALTSAAQALNVAYENTLVTLANGVP